MPAACRAPPFNRHAGHPRTMPLVEEGAAVLENGDRRLEGQVLELQRVARARDVTISYPAPRCRSASGGGRCRTCHGAHLVETLVRHAACGKRPSGKRACASRKRPPGPEFNSVSI